jgi:heptosyltransferase-1
MEVSRILVVRMSALGDVVHALPSLAALHELYPEARISWLVEPAGAQLLQGHPLLDRLYVFDRPRWKREARRASAWPGLLRNLRRLVRDLRSARFDLVIDFQCNLRSAVAVRLSGGRRRMGFAAGDVSEWAGTLFTTEKAPPCPPLIHKVEKNLALVRALGWKGVRPQAAIAIPPAELAWARQTLSALPGRGPVIALHPAVSRFGEIKRWPAAHFTALADRAREDLDARILITWGPGERETAEAVERPTLAPTIESPLRLAALVSISDAVVASDTAPLHIAAALGVPTVGLYGPKDERIYGPFQSPRSRNIRSGVPCSPCRLRRCSHRICMSMLFPEEVFQALREVLAAGAGRTLQPETQVPSESAVGSGPRSGKGGMGVGPLWKR